MAAGDQRREHEGDLLVLADHDALDVVEYSGGGLSHAVCVDLLLPSAWLTHDENVPLRGV